MKKLLFPALATFAILSCSNHDDMPCVLCSNSYVYCLYNSGNSYRCEYMSTNNCYHVGVGYNNSSDCNYRLYSSSSNIPSSSSNNISSSSSISSSISSSSSSSNNSVVATCSGQYCRLYNAAYPNGYYCFDMSSAIQSCQQNISSYQRGIEMYQQAIQRDPQNTQTYQSMIETYQRLIQACQNSSSICSNYGSDYTYTQSCLCSSVH